MAIAYKKRRFVILSLLADKGGLKKRMQLLDDVLRQVGKVDRYTGLGGILKAVAGIVARRCDTSIIFYSSLLSPVVIFLKIFRRHCRIYYMVRGDEYSYTKHSKRYLRAQLGWVLQRLLVISKVRFVFVSEDLREVFEKRYGQIRESSILPNTLGKKLPRIRSVSKKIALVGDFGTVKNVESVVQGLEAGRFTVDLYGNTSLPAKWSRPWLCAHGFVDDLPAQLRKSSVLVLASTSEGFPNVMLDALGVGCGVVVKDDFPFRRLEISNQWRFSIPDGRTNSGRGKTKDLNTVLIRLQKEKRDFKKDNPEIVSLVESDWGELVRRTFS